MYFIENVVLLKVIVIFAEMLNDQIKKRYFCTNTPTALKILLQNIWNANRFNTK